MEATSSYKTINNAVKTVLYKEKGSKFYGYAFPVVDEQEVKQYLITIKKKYHDARHWCYAYRLGADGKTYRVNDDGEPGNTAGQPIYGRLLAFDVTNVLVIVVRYFGGVKLGVGGLIKSYRACAHATLEDALVVDKEIKESFKVVCHYDSINQVMRIVKSKNLEVVEQIMHLDCTLILQTSLENLKYAKGYFLGIKNVKLIEK